MNAGRLKVLSLDGGGAKGFYTLGVLREVEAAIGCRLCEKFELIYGTSTGSIIAALLALGLSVDEVHRVYAENVLKVVGALTPKRKSAALARLGNKIFGARRFDEFRTGVGIVSTRWLDEHPLIFKNEISRAAGRKATFVPGFGCTISDAVQASCSAYPLFDRKTVILNNGDAVELIDGGYCANNPSLYALADAISVLGKRPEDVALLSIGVGEYPEPIRFRLRSLIQKLPSVRLLNKTLQINTLSMAQLMTVLFPNVRRVRISDVYSEPEMATDLFENDLGKLNRLRQKGAESFGNREDEVRSLLELLA
jgi:patatin-like phospholipase/acyl hydrolase